MENGIYINDYQGNHTFISINNILTFRVNHKDELIINNSLVIHIEDINHISVRYDSKTVCENLKRVIRFLKDKIYEYNNKLEEKAHFKKVKVEFETED